LGFVYGWFYAFPNISECYNINEHILVCNKAKILHFLIFPNEF